MVQSRQLTLTGVGPVHWRENWARVRREPCDRERLRRSLQWAVFTVHSQVTESERSFVHWRATGTLRNGVLANQRLRALADVDAFCDALQWRRFVRASTADKLDQIVASVHGLSYAKATFALTFAGLADVACLDVHALRRTMGREIRRWRTSARYLSDVRACFGSVRGSGARQWALYEQWVPAFASGQHAIVFEHLLCNETINPASVLVEVTK